MTPTAQSLFADYAADHRHPMNQLTHKVAIPLIVFHVLAMLDWVKFGPALDLGGIAITPSLGHVAFLIAVVYYARITPRLAPLMAVLFALCFPIAAITPGLVVVGIAAVAWTVQLIGHAVYEKNRPSFTKNIVAMLVGPLFFVAVLTGAWRPQPR